MSDLPRRLRGPGIALVVLALSAGAALAGSSGLPSHPAPATADKPASDEPGEAAETPEPTETPEAAETPETQDTANAPSTQGQAGATATDTHGALVSAAAQMPTPAGFRNHGAFVSCVAHMKDMTLATIVWTTVTPESCAAASGNAKADAGKANGAAGKAKGAAKHAAAGVS